MVEMVEALRAYISRSRLSEVSGSFLALETATVRIRKLQGLIFYILSEYWQ